MANRFSIQEYNGALTFFKDGAPIQPLLFWQTEIEQEEARVFEAAGIEIYSFFRSVPHYEHPYWTGENQYDFSRIDAAIRRFRKLLPGRFCIPRIYVSAPYWWLDLHPEEMCGFAVEEERTRHDGPWQGTRHESFASERWKKEMGTAFRLLIRHIADSDYADCVVGIHVANGISGEWHYWSPPHRPDTSLPMQRRYGRAIPPPEKRGPEFYRCLHGATVEAIDHFCRIVKEESDFMTAVFYGYLPDVAGYWSIEGDHRGTSELLRLKSVDIVSAPHSYVRRGLGEDGLFRSFPASIALHGKLFIDEGDDRTCFDGSVSNGVEFVPHPGAPKTIEGSIQVIRREFGNMLTHSIGMWYMDLNGGNFRHPALAGEICRLKKWGDYAMRLPRRSNAEVAVFSALEGEFSMPERGEDSCQTRLYQTTLGELCKCGAPFDYYLIEDLTPEITAKYKMLVYLDGLPLPSGQEQLLDAGAQVLRIDPANQPDAAGFREIFRAAGVHIYLESNDNFSCGISSLMIHAAADGVKTVRLPEPRQVFDLNAEAKVGADIREFSVHLKHGETALYLLE